MIRARKTDEAKGSLTSMIDVVFLLLIFFMCLGFKTPEGKIDNDLPADLGMEQSTPPQAEDLQDVRLFLRAQADDERVRVRVFVDEALIGEVEIEKQALAGEGRYADTRVRQGALQTWYDTLDAIYREVKSRVIAQIRLQDGKRPVRIDADPDAPYAMVMMGLDTIRAAANEMPDREVDIQFTAPKPGVKERLGLVGDWQGPGTTGGGN